MKKIFSIFGALLVGAMMFSCSNPYDEDITFGTEITTSVAALPEFAAENAEAQTFNVESNGEWAIIAPAWLEIAPRTGSAGTTTVSVKPTNNYMMVEKEDGTSVQELGYARECVIQIAGEQDYEQVAVDADGDGEQDVDKDGNPVWDYLDAICEVAVKQAGDPNKVYTGPEKISVADFIAKADSKTPYELTGTITRIANTSYGNFDLTDETGTIYIYGLVDAEGEYCFSSTGAKLGDIITVQGTYTLYNTTHEIVNATYISHTEGAPMEIIPSSIGDFLEAANPTQLYELTGVVKNITGSEYGNFDLVDGSGSVYVYGLLTEEGGASKQFATLGVEEGDILTLVGNYATYNDAPQVGGAYHVSHIDVAAKTVTEFLAAEEGDDYYMVTGTVSGVAGAGEYGNIYLNDETSSVYVYGLLSGWNGAKKQFPALVEATGLKDGDTLTIIGKRTSYNDTPQVGSAFYFSHEAVEGGDEPEPEPEITTSTFGAITAEGTYKVENATVVAVTTKGYLLYDTTGYAYVYVGSKTDYAVGTKMTVTGAVTYYYKMMQIAPTTVEDVTTVEVTYPEAEEINGAAIDAYMSAPTYKYVKVTGKLSVDSFTNLIVEGTTNTVSVSYFDGDLSALNEKDVTLYGYLGGSNTSKGYATMYLVSYEEVVADEPSEGGRLYWGSEDFAAIQAAVGNELNATTLANVVATDDLTVNADGVTYKGLELSIGGGKFKFGTNYGLASQEGDKPTRIQVGGTGKIADMKNMITFEVPAAGTLKIDAVSSSKDEVHPIAVAIDGTEIGQYDTVMQGQEASGEIFTIDCSAAKAGSTIYVYSAKSGVNFFSIEYTY